MKQDWERMKRLLEMGKGLTPRIPPAPPSAATPESSSPEVRTPSAAAVRQDASIQWTEIPTPHGPCLVREAEFPGSHVHGNTPLEWLIHAGQEGRALLGKDPRLGEVPLPSLLFLDLETTGLGGAGTYAFLVGLGLFRGDGFVIRQYFMRDFAEERALLFALRDFLGEGRGVVSFNGKMFDLPLLSDRFLLNRMRSPLEDLPHLDLLFPARRLWRERIGSCSLVNLEGALLDMRRTGDVPSELIPSLYFRYLERKSPSIIEPVFAHNASDLLSLMALTARASFLVEDPKGSPIRHHQDYFCLGRIFEDLGLWEKSIYCYGCALEGRPQAALQEEARRRLSLMHKRLGDRPRAVAIWQSSLGDGSRFDPFSYEELAKHLEHREKDFAGAILIVEQALEHLGRLDPPSPEVAAHVERFRHRLHRLQCKVRGERWF